MKHLIGRTLTTLLGCAFLWLPGMAHAQSTHFILKANVPFEFKAGDRTVPAGQYLLVRPSQHFLELRDARGRTVASVFTSGVESSSAPASSLLKFYVSGDQHILAEVWQQGDQAGEQLYRATKDEVRIVAQSGN